MLFLISRINTNAGAFIQDITIFKGDYEDLKVTYAYPL